MSTLYVANGELRGERGPTGPGGSEGPRGERGPRASVLDAPSVPGFEESAPLDPDEVWQVIESDTTRLTDNVEFPEEEDPAAQAICDAMQLSSISELQDIGFSC